VKSTHGFVQTLLTQVRPCPQALPQAPQFEASLVKSTQAPPQATCGDAHDEMHVFPEQIWPALQSASPQHASHETLPQQCGWAPPQLACEHAVCAALQVSVVQPSPSLQSLSEQQTLHAVPQSFGVPGEQLQTPAPHAAPGLQAVPHCPQLAESVWRFVSQPAPLLQSP
jgi:hypothetical protein